VVNIGEKVGATKSMHAFRFQADFMDWKVVWYLKLISSSLLDVLAFLEDFAKILLDTHNWNSPHYFQNIFFCSMKHQNVILHPPSGMNPYGQGIRTILSSTCSKENLLDTMILPVSVRLL